MPVIANYGLQVRFSTSSVKSSFIGLSEEEKRLALRELREKIEPQHSNRPYDVCLRRVHSKLSAGVTTKRRRAPNLPLEIIDPAEFLYLELDGVNAVNTRTRETILYDLLVSVREPSEGKSEDSFHSEFFSAPRKPDTPGEARKRARPVSDRDLRAWYEARVAELTVSGEAPSGDADWEAAKRQFPERITRNRVRDLREQLAPRKWLKQGRRAPGTTS